MNYTIEKLNAAVNPVLGRDLLHQKENSKDGYPTWPIDVKIATSSPLL